jgi:hypothetical protein
VSSAADPYAKLAAYKRWLAWRKEPGEDDLSTACLMAIKHATPRQDGRGQLHSDEDIPLPSKDTRLYRTRMSRLDHVDAEWTVEKWHNVGTNRLSWSTRGLCIVVRTFPDKHVCYAPSPMPTRTPSPASVRQAGRCRGSWKRQAWRRGVLYGRGGEQSSHVPGFNYDVVFRELWFMGYSRSHADILARSILQQRSRRQYGAPDTCQLLIAIYSVSDEAERYPLLVDERPFDLCRSIDEVALLVEPMIPRAKQIERETYEFFVPQLPWAVPL